MFFNMFLDYEAAFKTSTRTQTLQR